MSNLKTNLIDWTIYSITSVSEILSKDKALNRDNKIDQILK